MPLDDRSRARLRAAMVAVVLALFLYWLAADNRPDGVLGALQHSFAFFFVVPYIVGAVVGGNAHDPNYVAFFVTLLVEIYALIALALALVRLARRSKGADRA